MTTYWSPCQAYVIGLATPGTGSLPCQSSAPLRPSKARRYASIAPVNTRPPPVTSAPLTRPVPVASATPNGARSSVVPTDDCQRILPAFRSTATSAPQGGALHGIPSGETRISRVAANGAPSCGPNSTPEAIFALSTCALGISLTV